MQLNDNGKTSQSKKYIAKRKETKIIKTIIGLTTI